MGRKEMELSIKIAGKMDKSLARAIGQAKGSVGSLSRTLGKIGTAGLGAMAGMTAGAVKGIMDCTKEATNFEKSMADVVKYVHGLADSTGAISDAIDKNTGRTFKENYGIMKDAILDLSAQIPYTADDLTKLAASAGQSGKAMEDLVQIDKNGDVSGFLKDVAIMGTAMDIDADKAGNWAAKWEKSFKMNHDEIMVLSDQINYLGANSATTAAEIGEVVNRAGSVGQLAGADVSTTAALADAMLATGVASNRAGTALKNFYQRMGLGSSATKAMKDEWEELGFTAEDIAKSMQMDSVGTITSVFNAINQLPEERRLAAIKNLFGMWTTEGAAKIANNMSTFTDALSMVNDPSLYAGSMEREFAIKTDTAAAADTMLKNAWKGLKADFGTAFLPVKKELAQSLNGVLGDMRNDMPQLKELGETLATVLAKGVTKLSEAIHNALPHIKKGLDYINNNGEKVAKIIGGLAIAFAGMKMAPLVSTVGSGVGSIFSAAGGVFSGGSGKTKKPGLISSLFGKGKAWGIGVGNGIGTRLTRLGDKGSIALTEAGLANVGGGGLFSRVKGSFSRGNSLALTEGGLVNTGGLGNRALNRLKGIRLEIGSGISNIAGGIGNFFAGGGMQGIGKGLLGGAGSLLTKGGGLLAGVVTGGLPILGGISAAVAGASLLYDNLDGVRNIIGKTFGDEGLKVFDKFKSGLDSVIDAVGNVLTNGIDDLVAPVKEKVVDLFETVFGKDAAEGAAAVFDSIVGIIDTILKVLGQVVNFANQYVKPIIQNIFNFISTRVVPFISNIFNTLAPLISTTISSIGKIVMDVGKVVAEAIQAVWPLVEGIAGLIMDIATEVMPIVVEVFDAAWATITSIVQTVSDVFGGVISFLTHVFKGEWSAAWEDIKGIFKSIWDGLGDIAINALKGIWAGMKYILAGLMEIASWFTNFSPVDPFQSYANVKGVSKDVAKGELYDLLINGENPFKAKGGFTNGVSIAGEKGTEAVISFDPSVRNQNIGYWERAGQLLGVKKNKVKAINGGSNSNQVVFAPNITIQGNADNSTVDYMLGGMQDMFEEWYEKKMKRAARTAY